mmetsp:Transcript_75605/g.204134  ORF Transcript_75605/g.204134 Transcript_75605/m.204134 type:complete len:432 (-) Transcript_75605:186-1481(-)
MLSLPAGVAAGTGLVVAICITAVFGAFLGYTFAGMGRICQATKSKNHKEAGAAVIGPRFGQFMAIVLMAKTAFTCVSYAMVIGESYSRILHFFGLHTWLSHPRSVLIIMMVFVLTPLCIQKDLSVLSYTSLFGIACEIFVVGFMQVRLLDGTYSEGGEFFYKIPAKDRRSFGNPNYPDMFDLSVTTMVLLASLSTAFIAHYNAPKFYSQMRKRSPSRFNAVVTVAFSVAFGIYVWVMAVGYLTFGTGCEGLILNNYSEEDPWAMGARVAIGFAVLFGFPLSFTALRDSTMATFGLNPEQRRWFYGTTSVLIVLITVLGCELDDLGLVNSLGGAVFGALITLVFPATLFYCSARKEAREVKSGEKRRWFASERPFMLVLLALGVFLLLFGSVIVLLKKFSPETLGIHPATKTVPPTSVMNLPNNTNSSVYVP